MLFRSDIRYSLPAISSGLQTRLNEVTPQRRNEGFIERLTSIVKPESVTRIRQNFLNRYERLSEYDKALREMIRKAGGPQMLADQSAEQAALFSDLSAGVAASAMGLGGRMGGVPVYRNGITTIDPKVKGLCEALKPLAQYGDPEI